MRGDITIREYEETECDLSEGDRAALRELFGEKIRIIPRHGNGRCTITATSWVGTATLADGRRLIVEPKVPVRTLFGVLAEVYDGADAIFSSMPFDYDTLEGLFEFVVGLFVTRVEDLVARGLLRGYRTMTDEPPAVRGRLLVRESLARHPGLHHRHICSHGEITADRPENRILAWTIHLLAGYDYRSSSLPNRLRRLTASLAAIPLDADAGLLAAGIVHDRLNEHYRPALTLARLLLEHLTYSGGMGMRRFLAFALDMNALFESYLTAVLRRSLEGGELRIHPQDQLKLDEGKSVELRPDVVLYRRDRPLLVIDAKYKPKKHREDLYQMVAYCHALDIREAALIHPAVEGAPEGCVDVRGMGGLRVHYHRLDLSGSPEELRRSADELAASLLKIAAPSTAA